MKIKIKRTTIRTRRGSGKAQRHNYKLKKRQSRYTHKENIAKYQGRTTRTATLATAGTVMNERNAKAREEEAKQKANRTYRFGADIIKRQDQDVTADDQVLQWVK